MTIDAGYITETLNGVRNTLALTDTWQEWTSSNDQASALDRLYRWDLPSRRMGAKYTRDELVGLRPCGVVTLDPDLSHKAAEQAEGIWQETISVMVLIEANTPMELADDFSGLMDWFFDRIDGMFRDARALARTNAGDVLHIHSAPIMAWDRIEKAKREKLGDHVWAIVGLNFQDGVLV